VLSPNQCLAYPALLLLPLMVPLRRCWWQIVGFMAVHDPSLVVERDKVKGDHHPGMVLRNLWWTLLDTAVVVEAAIHAIL